MYVCEAHHSVDYEMLVQALLELACYSCGFVASRRFRLKTSCNLNWNITGKGQNYRKFRPTMLWMLSNFREHFRLFASHHHNTDRDGEKNVQRYGRGIAAYNFAVFLILFFVLHLVRCQRLENLRCQKTFLYKWITAELKMANTPTQLTHTLWSGMVKFEFARKCFIFVLFGRCLLYSMCDMVHSPGDHIFSFTC